MRRATSDDYGALSRHVPLIRARRHCFSSRESCRTRGLVCSARQWQIYLNRLLSYLFSPILEVRCYTLMMFSRSLFAVWVISYFQLVGIIIGEHYSGALCNLFKSLIIIFRRLILSPEYSSYRGDLVN